MDCAHSDVHRFRTTKIPLPCPSSVVCPASFNTELGLEQVVHRPRVRFTAGGFHHLADEPAYHRRLCLCLPYLLRIAAKDIIDERLDGGDVGHLPHPAR